MRRGAAAALALAALLCAGPAARAEPFAPPTGDPERELTRIRLTCYWGDEETASGETPYRWMLAGQEEWLGRSCVMYADTGRWGDAYLGIHEFRDTGAGIDTDGDGTGDSIRNGTSIDMYFPTEEEAQEWNRDYGDYVWIRILPEGTAAGCGE